MLPTTRHSLSLSPVFSYIQANLAKISDLGKIQFGQLCRQHKHVKYTFLGGQAKQIKIMLHNCQRYLLIYNPIKASNKNSEVPTL